MPSADATRAAAIAAVAAHDARNLDVAVADVARLADRPASGWTTAAEDELFLAALRLRDAYRAHHAATVAEPVSPVTGPASDVGDEFTPEPAPAQPCGDFAAWCAGACDDDFQPDVRGTRRDILHSRRWALDDGPIGHVSLAQLEIPPESPRGPRDGDVAVCLDYRDGLRFESIELTIDQADRLAAGLYKAVDMYRQAGR